MRRSNRDIGGSVQQTAGQSGELHENKITPADAQKIFTDLTGKNLGDVVAVLGSTKRGGKIESDWLLQRFEVDTRARMMGVVQKIYPGDELVHEKSIPLNELIENNRKK